MELARVEAILAEEIDRYFAVILPTRIAADFRGNGYEMLWRMLEAHDRGDLLPSTRPPSRRACAMAARVRGACPPRISADVHPGGAGVVLGRFTQVTTARGLDVVATREVELFPRAMLLLAVADEDALRAEIALTIFHEYIHYFESFLLRREQPLRGREQNERVETLDHVEARRRDRRHTRLRIAKWTTLGGLAVAVLVATLVWQLEGKPEPAASVAPVVDAAETARVAAEGAARDRALLAHVEEIVARDVAPEEAVKLVGAPPTVAFAPGHDSPLVPRSQLVPDPRVPGARESDPDAALAMLWAHDRSADPPRLVGVAWSVTTGHPVRIDVVVGPPR